MEDISTEKPRCSSTMITPQPMHMALMPSQQRRAASTSDRMSRKPSSSRLRYRSIREVSDVFDQNSSFNSSVRDGAVFAVSIDVQDVEALVVTSGNDGSVKLDDGGNERGRTAAAVDDGEMSDAFLCLASDRGMSTSISIISATYASYTCRQCSSVAVLFVSPYQYQKQTPSVPPSEMEMELQIGTTCHRTQNDVGSDWDTALNKHMC